jgi:hypothetical protein
VKNKNQAAVELGRRGGLKGGPARAAALSDEERSAQARVAAYSRWGDASGEICPKCERTTLHLWHRTERYEEMWCTRSRCGHTILRPTDANHGTPDPSAGAVSQSTNGEGE